MLQNFNVFYNRKFAVSIPYKSKFFDKIFFENSGYKFIKPLPRVAFCFIKALEGLLMFRAGLKSFFCSFVLSLFVLFGISKVYVVEAEKPAAVIPRKNISLFLKDEKLHHSSKIQRIRLTKPIEAPAQNLETENSIKEHDTEDIVVEKLSPAKVFVNTVKVLNNESKPEKNDVSDGSLTDTHIPLETAHSKKITISDNSEQKHAQVGLSQVKVSRVTESAISHPQIKADNSYSQQKAERYVLAALSDESFIQNNNSSEQFEKTKEVSKKEQLLIPLEKSNVLPRFISQKVKINSSSASSQVAMLDANKPISAVVENSRKAPTHEPLSSSETGWQTMAQKNNEDTHPREIKDMYKTSQVEIKASTEDNATESSTLHDSPWVKAQSAAFPKNHEVIKQKYYNSEKAIQEDDSFKLIQILKKEAEPHQTADKEVKVAGEVLDNIIIPIPQDILDDKNLMPNLVSDPKNKKLEDELLAKERGQISDDIEDIPFIADEKKSITSSEPSSKEEKSIFKSIASFFSSDENNKNDINNHDDFYDTNSQENSQIDSSSPASQKKQRKNKILPSEMRLAFQPEKAEISGKTLDWVRAFGQKALENDDVVLEIRIDGTASIALQQKRLNLLYNILTNLGLGYDKVNTVFTSRAPNTFILRVVKASEDSDKKRLDPASFYYRKW